MIKLKSYQEDAIKAIRYTFGRQYRQYVEMPTGSGKTITFLHYARKYHKNTLVIVPSKQLQKQVYESALLFYHEDEISRKGNGFDEEPLCDLNFDLPPSEDKEIEKEWQKGCEKMKCLHIVIINSIRGDQLDYLARVCHFDLVVIDEAHHSQAKSYVRFINTICEYSDPKFLGLTATPDRVDGKMLHLILQICSFKLSIEEMIENNHLSDVEGFAVKTKIDLSDVEDRNGDFSLRQLYKKLGTESRNRMIVELCKKEMVNRKTLVFCINIEHSKQITEMLNKAGIAAAHIDGSMSHDIRSAILDSFRSSGIDVLCNCQLLTEGFDEPSINGIILARPTRSRSLFTQMIGRGLRLSPGKKNCKIIDIVDNHKNLAGFTSLITDENYRDVESFKTLKDIKRHVETERLNVTEVTIHRVNLFNEKVIDGYEATDSMIAYLNENEIEFFEPISFDEGSFLIFMNELKKEYEQWQQSKKDPKKMVKNPSARTSERKVSM